MKPARNIQQQLFELLSSMRFAVSLLTVLGIASIIGTVLKQNEPYENYIVKFGQFWFELFEKLGLYDVYHASWFLLILLFLVISTTLCIYRNTPQVIKEWKVFKEHASEKSLRAFSHQASISSAHSQEDALNQTKAYLTDHGYVFKQVEQTNGDTLIAAKSGTHQRLGYLLTHAAIVIICFGGLLDGNLIFKIQEWLGQKQIEVRDILASQVPEKSRLSVGNPSFRANMTLPEGTSSSVAFVRMRDGYLIQELPFRVALKDFRIEHYATGQPKSFESDVVIIDPDLEKPLEKTIRVNHPLIYKGIAIYQSDFQDGGSSLTFKVWNLASKPMETYKLDGTVSQSAQLGKNSDALKVEFDAFRKFNILNLSPDGKGKPKNVGPNTTYKLRDMTGQAKEYVSYMQPLHLDDKFYFVTGMRETVQEDFRYLRIPADDDLSLDGFMYLRAYMMDPEHFSAIARRLSEKSLSNGNTLQKEFETSVVKLLETFRQGGYDALSQLIEQAVPEDKRESAAQAYFKLMSAATLEAYNLSLEARRKSPVTLTPESFAFIEDALNAMNDLFFFGSPYYFQLQDYVLKEASGLQLTRSPGQKWVYLGSALLVLGIFAMFYIRERRVWLLFKRDNNEVLLAMATNRKNMDFDQDFERTQLHITQLLSERGHAS